MNHSDYLEKAMYFQRQAEAAVKTKKFDEAWEAYNKQKQEYYRHANRYGHTAKQAVALEASVHEGFANVLRLEKKHLQAFMDILYWVIASKEHLTKKQNQKLVSYFNRCKFNKVTIDDVYKYIDSYSGLANLREISKQCQLWCDT